MSEASVSASYSGLEEMPLLVGPATGKEFNQVRSFLVPKGCFRLEDNSFEFDSSFVNPVTFNAGPLKNLLDKHPGSNLSIFGHADPTGNDHYNKVLSGRRAQAIYGLLIRKVDLWQELYFDHDTPGDMQGRDTWGVRAIQIMLNFAGPMKADRADGELDQRTRDALAAFEAKHKLPPAGFNPRKEVTAATFRMLTDLYMNQICTDDDGNDFRLKPADFLAGEAGERQGGKGNFQGCSEFNPVIVFSKEEEALFKKEENKWQRNSENRPNRRVMVLLFRAGTEVDPDRWPCPNAKEGISGCRARFFSDGDQRRNPQAERRKFEESLKGPSKKSTFACRFYERVAFSSPCEALLNPLAAIVHDELGRVRRNVEVEVTFEDGSVKKTKTDDRGRFVVTANQRTEFARVRFAISDKPGDIFFKIFFVDLKPINTEQGIRRRLHNLGYLQDSDLVQAIKLFQGNHGLNATGEVDEATRAKLERVHNENSDVIPRLEIEEKPISDDHLVEEGILKS
ncbi:MAG: peptidoglycan-binding protein [Acidobacteriota bacterium]